MPEGSLTLRVKVPRDRGTKEYPSRPRGVRGRDPLGDKNLAGVSPRRQMVAFRRQLEIALPIVPERCSWEVLQQSELQGASGPQSVSRLLKRPKASRWSAKWSPGPS